MMQLSQMGGFVTLLIASMLFFMLSSMFGHDGDTISTHDGVSSDDNGPSLLSLRNLFLFGVGFGAAGAIATHLGMALIPSCVAGILAGAVFALLGWWFYRTISKQQASTNTNTANLVGKKAIVTTMIPKGHMGQVTAQDEHGSTVFLDARSDEDRVFGQGEQVFITEAAGSLVTVAKQFN